MNLLEHGLLMHLMYPPHRQFQRGHLALTMEAYYRQLQRRKHGRSAYMGEYLRLAECQRLLVETEDVPGLEEWLVVEGGPSEAQKEFRARIARYHTELALCGLLADENNS